MMKHVGNMKYGENHAQIEKKELQKMRTDET